MDNLKKVEEVAELVNSKSHLFYDSMYSREKTLPNELSLATKQLYSLIKKELPKHSGPLPELIVDNLTLDQIWEEIALAGKPLQRYLSKGLNKVLRKQESIDFPGIPSKEERQAAKEDFREEDDRRLEEEEEVEEGKEEKKV